MNYKKIEIRSVDDLPKEKGIYFSFAVDEDENLEPKMVLGEYDPENSECVKEWMKFCKWYLLPVHEVTDEEIEEYAQRFTLMTTLGDQELLQENLRKGIIYGAKWMRDGKINNVKR